MRPRDQPDGAALLVFDHPAEIIDTVEGAQLDARRIRRSAADSLGFTAPLSAVGLIAVVATGVGRVADSHLTVATLRPRDHGRGKP